jgi:hypothetical protein
LECNECGANLIILTGRGKDRKNAAYGCPHHYNRGTCFNDLYQRRDRLEETLLSSLQKALLDDKVIEDTLAKVLKAVMLAESEQIRMRCSLALAGSTRLRYEKDSFDSQTH